MHYNEENLQNFERKLSISCNTLYIKHERQYFIVRSKHREENSKYDEQRSILDEIRGVWIANETLSRVFDIHFYYMEESVLLGTKPLVDSIRHFIRDPSGVFSVCHLCECRIVQ